MALQNMWKKTFFVLFLLVHCDMPGSMVSYGEQHGDPTNKVSSEKEGKKTICSKYYRKCIEYIY